MRDADRILFMDLPPRIKAMTVRMFDIDDYYDTVIINASLSLEEQRKAYLHELAHIGSGDFEIVDCTADQIEALRHAQ